MHKRTKAYVLLLLSTFAVSQFSGYAGTVANAAATTTTAVKAAAVTEISTLAKLSSMKLGSSLSVKLSDVGIFTQDSGNVLTYTLTYTNSSSNSVNLADYFSKVVTPGGSIIKGIAVTADASIKKIAAKETTSITYYANIGQAATVKGLKVNMYGWNFSAANYEQRIGTFTVPSNFSLSALQGESKKIKLNSIPVTTQASSLQIYSYNGKTYARVRLSVTNLGTQVLSNPSAYTMYLKSAGGSIFTLALDESTSEFKVQPQEKKLLYYTTEIPSSMNTANMTLQIAELDETLKLNLPVASYSLPAAVRENFTIAAYGVKQTTIDDMTVEMQLQQASVYAENGKGVWNYQLRVKNSGSKAVTIPAYELSVRSAEGYVYPITTSEFSSLTLAPLEEKYIQVSTEVPLTLAQDTLYLQVITPANADASTVALPLAYFKIPYALETTTTVAASETQITNNYGTFGVSIASLQRLPWGNEDLVTAKLNIRNTTANTITLPTLKGIIKVDQTDLSSSSQLIVNDESTVIAPGATVQVSLLAHIPYSLDFKQTRFILQETDGSTTKEFLSLTSTDAASTSVAYADSGESYQITTTGKKANLKERLTTIYEGTGSNIVYTETVLTSEETRQANLSQLYAYFKTADGEFYQATANQPSSSTSPGGQSLVTFWAQLPTTVDTSGLSLYVGEGVADGALVTSGTEATGYINTFALPLAATDTTPQTDLSNLTMFPYSLSITNAVASHTQNTTSISLSLNYRLAKDTTYGMGDYEHKLVVQFTDPYGQSFEETLALGSDITVGTYNTYSTTFNSNLYKALHGGTYRITLYDEFQGQRIELGNKTYSIDYTKATTTTSTSSDTDTEE